MNDKFFYYNTLFPIYRDLLTLHEQEIFSFYYEENNSMGEIAELKNISRSAVGRTIKNVEKKLDEWESILKIHHLNEKIEILIEKCSDETIKRELENLLK